MLRMITLILILSFIFRVAICPPHQELYIIRTEPIKVFDKMLYAFQSVESSFRTDVVNSLEYTGILQEGPEMIAEANRINEITGNPRRYTFPASALDPIQAVNVWYDVQNYHNPAYTLRKAVKIWNPLGTPKYYSMIKKLI